MCGRGDQCVLTGLLFLTTTGILAGAPLGQSFTY